MTEAATLDPPGSIAVIGAGPLGIEAALYGRYLGYDVTVFEAESIASSLRERSESPLHISPDRCASPLALSAIAAQFPERADMTMPMTTGEWIENLMQPLSETDLLRGRIRCPAKVLAIETVPIELEEGDDPEDDVPPDFRLSVQCPDEVQTHDVEAVIVATNRDQEIELKFATPAEYFFRLERSAESEDGFVRGLHGIASIFAGLAGRADLDLYRPKRA